MWEGLLNILFIIEDSPSQLKVAHHTPAGSSSNMIDSKAELQTVAAIKADKPDLILLDLESPGVNSLELVKKLKGDPETRHIQIVAVTAHPERYPKAKMLEAGCAGCIAKPINTRLLPLHWRN
jgi:two-component system, OmpR family, alkaline phosphatase synthesis response regulator PhoP